MDAALCERVFATKSGTRGYLNAGRSAEGYTPAESVERIERKGACTGSSAIYREMARQVHGDVTGVGLERKDDSTFASSLTSRMQCGVCAISNGAAGSRYASR